MELDHEVGNKIELHFDHLELEERRKTTTCGSLRTNLKSTDGYQFLGKGKRVQLLPFVMEAISCIRPDAVGANVEYREE